MKRLVLLALLAGCTTLGPDYERPAAGLPSAYPVPVPAGESAKTLPAQWWTLYRDTTLEQLVDATRANNADVKLAAARVLEAEAVLREAGTFFYPEVVGGITGARSRVSSQTVPPPVGGAVYRTQHGVTASTSFELDFWGRYARADEAARANLLGSRLSQDVVALTLAGTTAQAYFALRSLDAQLVVLDNTIRVRSDSLELARARANAGLASELDVHQAQGALSDALAQRREAGRQRAVIERQLAQLTGRFDLKVLPGELFSLPLPPVPPPGLPSELLERRADIRAAEQALVAANAQIGIARAALFPSISLTAALGSQSAQLGDLLAGGAGIWSLGYALALPIFDAGRREARVEQTEARREQALAGYQRAIETGFREVSEAFVNVEQTGATEADLLARLEAARRALELSTLRYESGYSPYLEVLDAQRNANDAELAYVRNRQARLAFSVDLMRALGGGW
jgi:multidrug efflux system outer membrane protein